MELKVREVVVPEKIEFNYEELKNELQNKVQFYTSLVYTDEQIRDAKNDRASLNKLKKALNDERIRREREYMLPFNDFKQKINEIIGIIDEPVKVIDTQIKTFEEKVKEEKLEKIKDLFETIGFQNFVKLEMIFDNKWLNASVSMKKIEEDLRQKMFTIGNDVATLNGLKEFGFEALEVYKKSLNLSEALSAGQRMAEIQKKKEEEERKKEEFQKVQESNQVNQVINNQVLENQVLENQEVKEEIQEKEVEKVKERMWVRFAANLTADDAIALKEFFKEREIEYCQV
jgi:hypothetical protein